MIDIVILEWTLNCKGLYLYMIAKTSQEEGLSTTRWRF